MEARETKNTKTGQNDELHCALETRNISYIVVHQQFSRQYSRIVMRCAL